MDRSDSSSVSNENSPRYINIDYLTDLPSHHNKRTIISYVEDDFDTSNSIMMSSS